MSTRASLNLSKTERTELERAARRPSTPQGLARRCRVVLLDDEGLGGMDCVPLRSVPPISVSGTW